MPGVLIEYIVNAILLCGAIAWAVFGTVFLVNDRKKCGGYNRFWVYCCASLFSAVFGYFISLHIYTKDKNAYDGIGQFSVLSLIAFVLFEVPFAIWGIYSIYLTENVCHNEMYDEDGSGKYGELYIWSQVTYWIRIVYFLLNMVGVAIVIMRQQAKKGEKTSSGGVLVDDTC